MAEQLKVRGMHARSRADELTHQSRDPLMRPVLVEKDRLRMRAVLYRDGDEYPGAALRLLLIIMRQLTRLIVDGYVVCVSVCVCVCVCVCVKDRLRMRAVLYRDGDEYPGAALRLLLIIIRQLTRLIVSLSFCAR